MSDSRPSPAPPVEPQREKLTEDTVDTPERDGTGRRYECLNCGFRSEAFLDGCPDCGGTAFKTSALSTESELEPAETALSVLATLTAPFNPYLPR